MRPRMLLPLLLVLLVGGCVDVVGPLGRSLDGTWSARIGGETVWFSLRDDGRDVYGEGRWGYDPIYVRGDRTGSDVYLRFEFDRYRPIELEGTLRSGEIEGRLYGSGWNGDYVRFYRE